MVGVARLGLRSWGCTLGVGFVRLRSYGGVVRLGLGLGLGFGLRQGFKLVKPYRSIEAQEAPVSLCKSLDRLE